MPVQEQHMLIGRFELDPVLISPGLATMLHMLHPLTDIRVASFAVKGLEDSEAVCEFRISHLQSAQHVADARDMEVP